MAMRLEGGSSRRPAVRPSMNVTPLVDVVLVLLIIFMVVAPLLAKQVWVELPKTTEAAREDPARARDVPLLLRVDARGAIWINRDEVSASELGPRLARLLAARGDGVVYVDADDDTPYGALVHAMDTARAGGAKTMAVLTKKAAPLAP